MKPITQQEVKELQEETGQGIMWCKRELQKMHAIEAVQELHKLDGYQFKIELLAILDYLVKYK